MPFEPIAMTTDDARDFLVNLHGEQVNTQHLLQAADHFGCSYATMKKRLKAYKTGIGKWNLTVQEVREQLEKTATPVTKESLVPTKDVNYVPFGNYADVKKIIQSKIFYPSFITGMSGNGKTFGVEQACAAPVSYTHLTLPTNREV